MDNLTSRGAALITGGSTGIGMRYAGQLAHRGFDVILISNHPARIFPAIGALTRETGRSFEIVGADLGTVQGMREVASILGRDASISLIVNHCDVASIASPNGATDKDMDMMIKINIIAMEYFSAAAIPHFIDRGRGAIINIASIVNSCPECFDGRYEFLNNKVILYSEELRRQFSYYGVYVQAASFGTSTPDFWNTPFTVAKSDVAMLPSADFLIHAALKDFDRRLPATAPSLGGRPYRGA